MQNNIKNKIKIEKNSVQETLMLPLYAKYYAMKRWPGFFFDKDCVRIKNRVDYDFSRLEARNGTLLMEVGAMAAACRQLALAAEIRDYLRIKPKAAVVLLGCGLDTTGRQADNNMCRFINIDFPNVIDLRNHIIPGDNREINITADLKKKEWINKIQYNKEEGAVFAASGVFMYWKRKEVRDFFAALAKSFPESRLTFDCQNKKGSRTDERMLKRMGINIEPDFYLNDPKKELELWKLPCKEISCKKMISDFKRLDKRFSFMARFMAAYSEMSGMAQINTLDF